VGLERWVKEVRPSEGSWMGSRNWVADEILHHACIHPEQYCNTLTDEQCKQLHESLTFVCKTACDLLGDSDQYPSDWIFKYRWSKGKKDALVLPNGEKIEFVTAGGRTSAFVASRQKKTGPVAADLNGDESDEHAEAGEEEKKPKSKSKSKKTKVLDDSHDDEEGVMEAGRAKRGRINRTMIADELPSVDEPKPKSQSNKRRKTAADVAHAANNGAKKAKTNGSAASSGSRRSGRQK